MIEVEVVHAVRDKQRVVRLRLAEGARVEDAIRSSGLLDEFTGIDLARNAVGIFGRRVRLDTPLETGDRVEIYRPLQHSPPESRRRRARGG